MTTIVWVGQVPFVCEPMLLASYSFLHPRYCLLLWYSLVVLHTSDFLSCWLWIQSDDQPPSWLQLTENFWFKLYPKSRNQPSFLPPCTIFHCEFVLSVYLIYLSFYLPTCLSVLTRILRKNNMWGSFSICIV